MLNNILNNKAINTALLSLVKCEEYYESFGIAQDVSERFIQAAGSLPVSSFLGIQINADKDLKHRVYAFSGPGVKVSAEDFNWLLQKCASAEIISQASDEDTWGKERRIYALRQAPGSFEPKKDSGYLTSQTYFKYYHKHYKELFEALGEIGGSIRITTSAEHGGSCTILVSLPSEMTLRMRAMLSFAFLNTKVIEVNASDDTLEDTVLLPTEYITDALTGSLGVLVFYAPVQDHTEEFGADTASSDESNPTEDDTFELTPIEDLNLSVRTFNCLKRAGINTLEKLRTMSDDDLLNVRNMSRKCMDEIKSVISKASEAPAQEQPALEQPPLPVYSNMLDEMIGLENVKEQVKRITALAKMKREMAELGKEQIPVVLNMEFTGNPGTAKTTVARILAGLLNEVGLLSSSEIVEVGRADLIGQYIGHTADRVKEVFCKAKGKLLFIDEAYSLVDNCRGSFGDEAINTIVQEMENNREDTIVVFAGYTDKMEEFFSRNPGLRSRVPFRISFSDYSANEMVQITEFEAKKRGFSISPGGMEKIASICAEAAKYPNVGNGRFCRNLAENAILNYAARTYGNDNADTDKKCVLIDADIEAPKILHKAEKAEPIGFRV